MATETIPRTEPHRREASPQPAPRRARGSRRPWRLLVWLAVVTAAAAGGLYWFKGSYAQTAVDQRNVLTHKVGRGSLLVTVTDDGNIESSANIDVKCEVAGGSTILWIVPDGTSVNEGDEVVRLDSSLIEEQVDQQKIAYEKARAVKIEAEKTFAAAKIAVQEYSEGTYLQALQTAEVAITVAQENLRSAENSFQFAQKMARKGYVTSLERDARQFAVERAKLDLVTANLAKEVLARFTKPKTEEDLISKRDTAEAKMRSEEAAFDLEESRLKRLQTQLEKSTIRAPQSGMVIYANEPGGRPGQQGVQIEEGSAVRERQSIVRVPDLAHMQVKCTIHESKVDQIRPGMRANLRVQDHTFHGTVASVANQPEPTSFFSSGNVKEYATIVKISGESSGLRPGMTAVVEILVEELKNVIVVPVEGVVEQGNRNYCWVVAGNHYERRPVVLGMSNNTEIEVKDGLAEGDMLVLNPRAVISDARDADDGSELNVKEKFGEAPPPGAAQPAGAQPGGERRREGRGTGGGGGRGINIAELDKNGDKKVSREEAPERMQAFFDKIDTDSDGFIDAKEAAAAQARRRKAEQEGGFGGGPGGPGGGGPGGGGPGGP
ncbi:MAG TPA: efflux RND transporter periplasmic adaptor subunit [Pirellulales bacterium]|nr:efflux RND transporter periplasmic adaptor subunit [Pirellulales bacterium]